MSNRSPLIFRNAVVPYPGAYRWRAAINSVVDGDTVWVERDSGCRSSDLIELRLTGDGWRGFNADERFTEGGKIITAEVKRLIPEFSTVLIETQPDTEKYGRWLSPILVSPAPNEITASTVMVAKNDQWLIDLAAYLVTKYPSYCRWKDYK
jgi:hypothetical protein